LNALYCSLRRERWRLDLSPKLLVPQIIATSCSGYDIKQGETLVKGSSNSVL